MLKLAARLEWKSFFVAGKAQAKRLGTLRQAQDKLHADKAAQIDLMLSGQEILDGKNLTIFEFYWSSRASD